MPLSQQSPGNDNTSSEQSLERVVTIIAYVFCTAISVLIVWPLVTHLIR